MLQVTRVCLDIVKIFLKFAFLRVHIYDRWNEVFDCLHRRNIYL